MRKVALIALCLALPLQAEIIGLTDPLRVLASMYAKHIPKAVEQKDILKLAFAIGKVEQYLIHVEQEVGRYYLEERLPCRGVIATALGGRDANGELDQLAKIYEGLNQARRVLESEMALNAGFLRETLIRHLADPTDSFDTSTMDALLGIERAYTEFNLVDRAQFPGDQIYERELLYDLASSTYTQARRFYSIADLTSTDVVWDLGSGHGRILLYGAVLFPEVKFKGVEIVGPRVEAAKRAAASRGLTNIEWHHKSVSDVDFSDGTRFFMFNPFPPRWQEVLTRLSVLAGKKDFGIYGVGLSTLHSISEGPYPWLRVSKKSGYYFWTCGMGQ